MLSGDNYKIKYHGLAGAGGGDVEDKAAFDRFMNHIGIGIAIADIIEDHPRILTMTDEGGDIPLHHGAKQGWVYFVKDIWSKVKKLSSPSTFVTRVVENLSSPSTFVTKVG